MTARITEPRQLRELLGIPFTPEQTACITAPPAPQVIVAGAGSGKTTVMAARVVWLVGTGQVAPEQVLGLTFTNKAAGELTERVRAALLEAGVFDPGSAPPAQPEQPPGEPVISTYHAFAGRLLTDHGLRIGLEPTTRLLADATRFQLAARVLREAPGPFPSLTRSFPDLVSDLLALDAELAEHLVDPEDLRAHDGGLIRALTGDDPSGDEESGEHRGGDPGGVPVGKRSPGARARLTNADLRRVPETAAARRELAELVGRYRAAKRARDLLDFGDQIALSATLARTRPEVGAMLRQEFRVVLLDEYQDTSVAQRILLAALFGNGTGHPVTAVGDPCQAIYGWRGASVANLDDFPVHFAHSDGRPAERHALGENRRSGGRLLALANSLAEPLRALHTGVQALRPASGAERDGTVRCALLRTHAEEIDWLADRLAHLVHTGTPPGEIAVLCRTAGDFAEIQKALVARDVPVEVVGLSGLLHLPEVADLVAVCEVLQDPGANASLVRLLTGPRWRIGPRDLALLGRRARLLVRHDHAPPADPDDTARRLAEAVEGVDPSEVVSLADALDTFLELPFGTYPQDDGLPFSPDARVRFAHLAAELRDLRRSLADPLMDVLHRVLTVTGLEVELSASPHALAARRRETLSNFLDVAASFAALDGEATLLAFLGFLRTAAQYEKGLDNDLPGGENTVKVLTAHKAKGLEWDVVAVPGLVAGSFPSAQGREKWTAQPKVLPHALRGDAATLPDVATWDAKGLKAFQEAMKDHQHTEELRLGYVTFTRPRSLLLGSGHWWGPTQKKPRGPSAFLHALHEHCAAGHGEIEAWAARPADDEENPALREATAGHAWPLPLDATALARRRDAAARVLAHLERPTGSAGSGAGQAPRRNLPFPGTKDTSPMDGPSPACEGSALHVPSPRPVRTPDRPTADMPSPADPRTAPGGSPGDVHVPRPTATLSAHSEELPPGNLPENLPPQDPPPDELTPEDARVIASWDRDLDALTGELLRAREAVREIHLPPSLTATELLRLAADPDGFARELARPMPRPPRPAARRGTRFHAWVESRFEALRLPMLDPDDLPGDDAEIDDERDLEALKRAFERTPYAHRTPYRVEAPFQMALAGRVVRGRIDAIYKEDEGAEATYEIVDWKTGRSGRAAGPGDPSFADPLQLAVYRVAWAEQQGVPVESVRAVFVHIRSGQTVRPERLPGRAELERILLAQAEHQAGRVSPAPDGSRHGTRGERPHAHGARGAGEAPTQHGRGDR